MFFLWFFRAPLVFSGARWIRFISHQPVGLQVARRGVRWTVGGPREKELSRTEALQLVASLLLVAIPTQ